MKIIKQETAERGKNSEKCKTIEYSFGDKDIDLGIAEISGRYPDKGYGMNLISKELIYVIEGNGTSMSCTPAWSAEQHKLIN